MAEGLRPAAIFSGSGLATSPIRMRKEPICAPQEPIRSRRSLRQAPASKVRLLFGGQNQFSISDCTDDAFVELMVRRCRQFLGRDCDLANVDSLFVRACYLEHFDKRSVDYTYIGKKALERSANMVIQPQQFEATRKKIKEAERAVNRPKSSMFPSDCPLAELQGSPLPTSVANAMNGNLQCPMCSQSFTTEGWYTIGVCGHRYHLQCLFMHALSVCYCQVCKAKLPVQLYRTLGLEKLMPELGPALLP